ncbi:RHS repeat-associated core domain-containing protein, partial [candidate division KSB1 bacterium]|nr:RHS repeat-associated core domain-containing protein [candidate division KSB1 bacterium]
AVMRTYTYDPFGDGLTETQAANAPTNAFLFTGQWYDTEIGQYCLRARMYDPALMRFTTRDPQNGKFTEPITLHRYLYCLNDPINRIDLTGEFSVGELCSTMFTNGLINGALSGIASWATGDGFLDGFAGGFMTGAITGGVANSITQVAGILGGAMKAGSVAAKFIEKFQNLPPIGKSALKSIFNNSIGTGVGVVDDLVNGNDIDPGKLFSDLVTNVVLGTVADFGANKIKNRLTADKLEEVRWLYHWMNQNRHYSNSQQKGLVDAVTKSDRAIINLFSGAIESLFPDAVRTAWDRGHVSTNPYD